MAAVQADVAMEAQPSTEASIEDHAGDIFEESAPKQPRNDIQVQLQYLKDDPIYKEQKPLQITPNFLDKDNKTNVKLAPGQLETIHDVRGREADFTLDCNGFKYVHAPTSFKEWSSQPKIAQSYLPELETLLRKEVDGCDEIMFYDARIRHADDAGLRVEGLSYNPFAKQVHTDNTEKSVLMKIRNLTDMKAEYLLSGRARIISKSERWDRYVRHAEIVANILLRVQTFGAQSSILCMTAAWPLLMVENCERATFWNATDIGKTLESSGIPWELSSTVRDSDGTTSRIRMSPTCCCSRISTPLPTSRHVPAFTPPLTCRRR